MEQTGKQRIKRIEPHNEDVTRSKRRNLSSNGSHQGYDTRPMPGQSELTDLMDLNRRTADEKFKGYDPDDGEPVVILNLLKNIVDNVMNVVIIKGIGVYEGTKSETMSFHLTVKYSNKLYKILIHYHPPAKDTNFLHAKIFPHLTNTADDNIPLMNNKIHTWLKANFNNITYYKAYPPHEFAEPDIKIFDKLKE